MEGLPSTSQQQAGWLPRAPRVPHCPTGLENLIPLDFVWVRQERELLEAMYGVETENRYYIKNHSGLNLYYAMEKSSNCARNCGCCCCGCRSFHMRISDYSGSEVIHLRRPCTCCYDEIHVSSPPEGVGIGTVEQQFGLCRACFSLRNAAREKVLGIRGPCRFRSRCFGCCCGRDVDFGLVDLNGEPVGKISRKWAGYETGSNADTFGVSFPVNLEVSMKAVVLGACILIDMIYFEEDAKKTSLRSQPIPH